MLGEVDFTGCLWIETTKTRDNEVGEDYSFRISCWVKRFTFETGDVLVLLLTVSQDTEFLQYLIIRLLAFMAY